MKPKSTHSYRVSVSAELYFTVTADKKLTTKTAQAAALKLLHDDGFECPKLPEGVCYHMNGRIRVKDDLEKHDA